MNVTVVGVGNIGTQFAVHCAEKGCNVTLFSPNTNRIHQEMQIVDQANHVLHRGNIGMATAEPKKAFSNADVIFVTVPAMCMKERAGLIEPYARHGLAIGLIPGTGGGECAFRECVKKGATVFGLQRVPSVARLVEYGRSVRAAGYRRELFAAAIPHSETKACCTLTTELLGIQTHPLPNYLNVTLTPSNPILHTARLYCLFKDFCHETVYPSVPLFYEDWNTESSKLLLQCDDEVQRLCKKLHRFDLSYVRSLRIHYESDTADALTKKLSGIEAFQGLKSPAVAVAGGYIPDLHSRYFTADFSFGLAILVQIAGFVNLEVPNMQRILDWYRNIAAVQKEFLFSDYGINSYRDFEAFYSA